MSQVELKQNFDGGLDLDSSPYAMLPNSYIDALNITRNSVGANQDRVVANIVGNRIAAYNLPTGRNKCIGAFPFTLRGTVIYFIWNSNDKHSVLQFTVSTRVTVPIFINKTDSGDIDILGFTENGKITSVNVYPRDEGDLLFFLDSLGRPTEMDITLFLAGTYTPVTRALIDTGKMPPLFPPSVVYSADTTRRANNLRNKFFRFKTRWIYDDFTKSTFSPISQMSIPISILSDVFTNVITNNNVILFTADSGGKNVKSIEIGVSFTGSLVTNNGVQSVSSDWNDFQSVVIIDKATQSIPDNTPFAYSFYNDSVYPDVDLLESIQLFDYIPEKANAQDMPNGNVLAFAGITEGYNKDTIENATITIDTVAAGSGGGVGNLDGVVTFDNDSGTDRRMEYTFSGIPAVGTVIVLKIRRRSDGAEFPPNTPIIQYTTISGDTADTVSLFLRDAVNASGQPNISSLHPNAYQIRITLSRFTWEEIPANGLYTQLTITPPTTGASTNSIASWMWGTEGNIARQYFDQKGKTNGVLYTDKVTFPAYAENGSQQPLIPFINYLINDVPPNWAYSFSFLYTPINIQWLFWESINMDKSETDYIYFDVTDFATNATKFPTTATVLNYQFQDGDRMKLIRRQSDNTVFADTYDAAVVGKVQDPTINGSPKTGQFIKIKKVEPFTSGIGTATNYVIMLYRPIQKVGSATDQVYNEFGRTYQILDPTLSTRRHGGQVTDQVVGVTPAEFNFYEGNAYFRSRTIATSDTGYATFNVMDANVVDFYTSAVNSISGRPSIIDINARRQYYSTLLRFGQAYQANTNINGLNRFYSNNFDEYDYNFGDIIRIKVRDRYLKVLQKYKIGVVPLYAQITKDATGNISLVVTDKLLNPIQYRVANLGLTYPESLASWHFADYGCDINKGVIWRDSDDGVIDISVKYKVDSWAVTELPLRTGNSKIYGAIDPKLNQYIIALEAATGSDAQTINFAEPTNTFDTFFSYHPEMMCYIGNLLITFKNGALYTHDGTVYNTFYGVNYGSWITPIFNKDAAVRKKYLALGYQANGKWSAPVNGDIKTSFFNPQTGLQQFSAIIDDDIDLEENVFVAAFNFDSNSGADARVSLREGDYLLGNWVAVKFKTNGNTFKFLTMPYITYIISNRNF